jgi:thymidylate synthase
MRTPRQGVRYRYGDLGDVVDLLVKNPLTRNAYLPVWFPEDTGIVHGGRAPCTLGYLFRLRDNALSIAYYIRSCDFRRHFQDDVYLTIRLLLWVIERCREKDRRWDSVVPGKFSMHIGSLHIFKNDYRQMFHENVEAAHGGHGS